MGTRKEIAERAGVSVSVVSRALNNSGYVSAEKREKILKIAQELDYHPNPVAMSLMSRRTRQILFMCKDLRNAFNIELYEGMIEAAHRQNYMIVLSGDMDLSRLPSLLVDGVIFPNEAVSLSYLEGVGKRYFLPAVTAAYGAQTSFPRAIPRVTCDMWKASSQMADYLHSLGHRKIACICPYGMDNGDPRVRVWVDLAAQSLKKDRDRYYIGVSRQCLPDDRRVLQFEEEQGDVDLFAFLRSIILKRAALPRTFSWNGSWTRRPSSVSTMRWRWDSASGSASLDSGFRAICRSPAQMVHTASAILMRS